jgi:hypothetical protein
MTEIDSERTPCEFFGHDYEPDRPASLFGGTIMTCADCGDEYEED